MRMINPEEIKLDSLPWLPLDARSAFPRQPCIYFAIDSQGVVQYIGRTVDLRQRWANHHKYDLLVRLDDIKIAYLFADVDLLSQVESALINWFRPALNGLDTGLKPSESGLTVIRTIRVSIPDLGKRIRESRKRDLRPISQIAAASGMSVQNWYRIEDERQAIPEDTLRIIEKVLGVDFNVQFPES